MNIILTLIATEDNSVLGECTLQTHQLIDLGGNSSGSSSWFPVVNPQGYTVAQVQIQVRYRTQSIMGGPIEMNKNSVSP